jgi:DNA-binding MarR family transcriptional regulator/GNAT superfamily N-acetyltransferase
LVATDDRVSRLRSFNRFYTRLVGVLRDGFLDTPYSLTEGRVLFEVGASEAASPSDVAERLELNLGYVSRVLSRLKERGLVRGETSPEDGRRQVVSLTRKGRDALKVLDARASDQVGELLSSLSDDAQHRLMSAIAVIESLLGEKPSPVVTLRNPASGDYGWVVQRHGALYAHEYGWDETCEAFIARIVADYVDHHDPKRESAWIAEVNGERVGCIFCVKKVDDVAQLRNFLVEPSARGMGIGSRLVEECIRFAKRARYKQMMLWTNDVLVDARRIYERFGFRLIEEEKHHSFGHDLVGQNWLLDL